MALSSDNVRVAVTGAVAVAPVGTTAPTSASSTIAPTNEVQTVTITGSPTGGTFTLTYDGQTTTDLNHNATAAQVQSALRALSNLSAEDVSVAGSAGGPFTATFAGALAGTNVVLMTATASLTGGTTPDVTVTATTEGVVGFVDLGYVGEDGVTETRDRSTNTIKAWQNGDIVREVITEASLTYGLTLLETKRETVELYYGNVVDEADGSIAIVPAKTGGRKAYVIDVVDGDDLIRIYVPSGEITEVGEQVYANGEAIGYPVTIRAYPTDAIQDGDGNNAAALKFYSPLVVAAA